MKRIKLLSLLAGIIILPSFIACSDFLDKEPDDMLTLQMVFDNKKKTEEWLARTYNAIQNPLFDDMKNQGCLSDEYQPSVELVQFDKRWGAILAAQKGSWSAAPSEMELANYWEDFYKAIRSAYIFIENVKALPEQGVSESDAEFMRHEARFVIAYYYTYLMQVYGPVPLIKGTVNADAPVNELMLPRTPLDEMLEYLDKELLELANFFPEELDAPAKQFGRPTKGACLAMRARMWTWAASPLFNGNPYYKEVVNRDGTPLFPQSVDPQKWQKAVQANKDVIMLAEKGIYDLYREYDPQTGNLDPFKSCQYLFLTSGDVNKEIIFARTEANNAEYERYGNPRGIGAYGSNSVTQNLVDEFRMSNGMDRLDPNSRYKEDGLTTEDIFYPNTYWNLSDMTEKDPRAGLILPKGSFNMYANREPRFYITIRQNYNWIPAYNRVTEYAKNQQDGRPSHDTPACGYHVRKGTHPECKPRENYWPYHPGIIFRLAEFYLNYAEALTETNPGNPDILKYVNLIRERGGIPPLPASLLGNTAELRKQIRKEFRIEFAAESKYRYDYIRRWKLAEEVLKTPIYGMNQYGYSCHIPEKDRTNDNYRPVGDPESFYTRTVVQQRIFQPQMYLWPIKQDFLDKNSNLVQNKGW
ncbi:RagB/SusD family nutrient uptake outer membrane protein [Parabacteroides pacaensis]|uniref:RagB/SusD family nutrient uptake outer membrane protein n=1 Tax=Parabacteroides pacaensis TaxID=2086575 RepID=UPI00131CFD01|nr:RagB/SusD family nutrient uptake outer membrane protein [Parabacteroides pacaensis]